MKKYPHLGNQKITIHQFHYSVVHSDAITNQMLFLQEALADIGVGGDIYAHQIKGDVVGRVKPLRWRTMLNCDLLLVHHSHGNPKLEEVLKVEVPKAIVYHNITPAEFLRHDPDQAELCRLGRRQLVELRDHLVGAFADSKYNSSELEALGYPESEVLPLYNLSSIIPAKADKKSPPRKGPTDLLFVGRVAKHKNQAALIKTFFYFKQFIESDSRLILVGGQDPIYGDYLKLLAQGLGIQSSVKFAGKVSDKMLRNYYQTARAFVCLSEHEGHCIPLVEAMAAGVPVFALSDTAVAETMGKAGVHLLTREPSEIAEALASVLESKTTVQVILKSQQQRLKELIQIQSKRRAQELLVNLVHELREGKVNWRVSPPGVLNASKRPTQPSAEV